MQVMANYFIYHDDYLNISDKLLFTKIRKIDLMFYPIGMINHNGYKAIPDMKGCPEQSCMIYFIQHAYCGKWRAIFVVHK